MNLILLQEGDFTETDLAYLADRRFDHIRSVHRAQQGDQLRVGLLGGKMGLATVEGITDRGVNLRVILDQSPPTQLNVTLLLALPRPKMLKRVLQAVTSLGVKEIYLINSYRVDKSYWKTPLLTPDKLQEHLILGLEQARDTLLPNISLRDRFKPFIEDELPAICAGKTNLVAHPVGSSPFPARVTTPSVLAIGPEGGFINYEIDRFQELNFTSLSLGERILRVETAVPVLLSRFSPC